MSEAILYREFIRNARSNLLTAVKSSPRKYSDLEVKVLRVGFNTAEKFHRTEKRESDRTKPFISHTNFLTKFFIDRGADVMQANYSQIHDTPELELKLEKRRIWDRKPKEEKVEGFNDKDREELELAKERAIESVINFYQAKMPLEFLEQHPKHTEYMRELLVAGVLNPVDSYYTLMKQGLALREINIMRFLAAKNVDRGHNSYDTKGFTSKQKLKSVFKSFFVANETKRWMVQRMGLLRRGRHRLADAADYYSEYGLSRHTISEYWKRRKSHVATRRFLFQCMLDGIHYSAVQNSKLCDLVVSAQQGRVSRMPEIDQEKIWHNLYEIKGAVLDYFESGGFNQTTLASQDSLFDGQVRLFDLYLRNPRLYDKIKISPEQFVTYAHGFSMVFNLLDELPNYYVRGFELGQFPKGMFKKLLNPNQ